MHKEKNGDKKKNGNQQSPGRGRQGVGTARAGFPPASAAVAPALPYQRHTAAGWARGGGVVAGPHSGADPRGRYPCP